jgi:hypothetical protein
MEIAYIFRYDQLEKKGILLYQKPQDKYAVPFIFDAGCCKDAVETDKLVYLDFDSNGKPIIERASLLNFKLDVLENLKSRYLHVRMCNGYSTYSDFAINRDRLKLRSLDELLFILQGEEPPTPEVIAENSCNNDVDEEGDGSDYDDITERFEIRRRLLFDFDEFEEDGINYEYLIDISNIYFWADERHLSDRFYGSQLKQLYSLYELLVGRWKPQISYGQKDQRVYLSPLWTKIFSTLSDDDLLSFFKDNLEIQPVLPERFCFLHLDYLSVHYGFPSKKVCYAFFRYLILSAKTTTDYLEIEKSFEQNSADNIDYYFNETKKWPTESDEKRETIALYSLHNLQLFDLRKLLKQQYDNVIIPALYKQVQILTRVKTDIDPTKKSKTAILALGSFLDAFFHCQTIQAYSIFEELIQKYERLEREDQELLCPIMQRKCDETILICAREKHCLAGNKAWELRMLYKITNPYIEQSLPKIVNSLVENELANVFDPEELIDAFKGSIISKEQLLKRIRSQCKYYSIKQLENCIYYTGDEDFPKDLQLSIQTRIIRERLNRYPADYSIELVLDEFNRWAKEQYGINKTSLDTVNAEYAKFLPEDRQWYLFEHKVISSPTNKVIRKHLHEIYLNKDYNSPLLSENCFQKAVFFDILYERVNNQTQFSLFKILSNEYLRELRDKGTDKIRFFLWVFDVDNDDYSESAIHQLGIDWYSLEEEDWNQIISFFHLLPNEQQVNLFKYLFYLKAIGAETFTVQELYERLTNHGKSQICIALQLTSYILNKKERSLESSISDSELDSIIYSGKGIQAKDKFSLFIKCDGPNVLSYEDANEDNYFTIGRVYDQESKEGSFFKIVFSDQHSYPYAVNDQRFDPDPFIREIVLECDSEHIYRIQKVLEENIPHIKKGNDTYLISFDYEIRVKEFMMKYHLEDHAQLFKNTSSHSLIPLQHHYREEYGKRTCVICDYIGCTRADSNHGIPFVQCGHSSCVCTNHFIVPVFDWDSYTIVDLLYILCGRDKTRQHAVWNEYKILAKSINRVIVRYLLSQQSDPVIIERLNHLLVDYDTPISDLEESEIKVIGNPDNEEECEQQDNDNDYGNTVDYKEEEDSPSYERYRGSWAQDEEGYSDEDIDTIFDGDPSAYWNID